MRNINLLDCTLRDGGYINDWNFGYDAIIAIIDKLGQTGIEIIEVGFIKGDRYDSNKTLFPDTNSFNNVLKKKNDKIEYVGMLDMSNPVALECIMPRNINSIDGIRVIFKKDKINEAYKYCEYIKKQGYNLYVNFVSTDAYSDKEFIDGIELFNKLRPKGVAIVDTFGMIKKKQFIRLIAIADQNMADGIMLCYHAHNNLQQAFGNAEVLVEWNTNRDIVIDACVFGMGRGAGNLNLELFAEYMNENCGKDYLVSPMLEIMDEYLSIFYKDKFWGYSLPLYLSAITGCHPNYAIYLAEKNTLSEKAFSELLQSISVEDKRTFSKGKAEFYYRKYLDIYFDDKMDCMALSKRFQNKKILLIAPGRTTVEYSDEIIKIKDDDTLVVCVNFYEKKYRPDFVFTSNLRRYKEIENIDDVHIIVTSNITSLNKADYRVNFSSYIGKRSDVFDNACLLALRLLYSIGVNQVYIAGMDGYSESESNYFEDRFELRRHDDFEIKNKQMSNELQEIGKHLELVFITPTRYELKSL